MNLLFSSHLVNKINFIGDDYASEVGL